MPDEHDRKIADDPSYELPSERAAKRDRRETRHWLLKRPTESNPKLLDPHPVLKEDK